MNYPASTIAQLRELAAAGDNLAAKEITRRKNKLTSLKNRLAKHRARPAPTTKRAATFRARDERILLRQIAALERGLPFSAWHDIQL